MRLCLNCIFCCRFTLHSSVVLAPFHLKRGCLKYILLKANKTGDLAGAVGCCRLSPVKVLSQASECVHLCLIHNLLVARCKLERKTRRGWRWPASSQNTSVRGAGLWIGEGFIIRSSERGWFPGRKQCLMELSGDCGPVGDYATVCP